MTSVAPDLAPVLRGRALAHTFELRCNHPGAGAALGEALATLRTDEPAPGGTTYDLLFDEATSYWSLYVDGTAADPPLPHSRYPVERLMWSINRAAVTDTHGLVRVHAAVAERDGLAVVLPASMEAGKTTLVTALVRDGFRYLSDEIAAIDPDSGALLAYPKPLGLDRGSWALFPDLAPVSTGGVFDRQWLVNPERIRAGAVARTARPMIVVTPRYRPGAEGTPEPLRPIDALRALVHETFCFQEHAQRDLDILTGLVRTLPCYRLEVDDLSRATSAIHALIDEHGSTEATA